ncbi:MAG: ABC transporter substrate-binding protein [bacterium]
MLKKTFLLAIILLFVFLNYSYAGNEELITLRVAWWGSQVRHDRTLAVIDLFEEQNPNVVIQPIYTSWREYWDRMAVRAASGNLPDIIQLDYKYFIPYYDNNLLAKMDSYYHDIIEVSQVDQLLLDSGKYDVNYYAIPAGINSYGIIYDPAKFAEAGIEKPRFNWTWEEYIEISKKLKDKLNIYAATSLPMATKNITGLEHYVRQYGQEFLNESSTGPGFSSALFEDFYNMDLSLTKKGIYAPADLRLENYTVENDLIVNGKTAMAAYWTNQLLAITEAAGRPLKMVPFPGAKDQLRSAYYLKPSMFWTIANNSQHPEIAAKFIDFITNSTEANQILKSDRGIPISLKIRKFMEPDLTEAEREMFEFIEKISEYASPIAPPPPPQFDRLLDFLEDLHFQILYERITTKEAAEEFRLRVEEILRDDT